MLVVGATGQLGSRVVDKLVRSGQPVRAFVRPGSRHHHLQRPGVDLAWGDLRDAATVDSAVRGVRTVVLTANSVAPRGAETVQAVEDRGYADLIDACRRHGVAHFIFISAPLTPADARVPLFRWKRETELRLEASGLPTTVFRAGPFMDDWFVFIGSLLPVRGDPAPLVNRPWDFLQRFVGVIGGLVERRGLALIPGSPQVRHSFICVDDVAEFLARSAAGAPPKGYEVFNIGGPHVVSWAGVAAAFSLVLGRKVRAIGTPSVIFRSQLTLMRPFSEAAANVMGLNWVAGRYEMSIDSSAAVRRFGVKLTSVEEFLRAKAALPE